ncbi:MAG: class I SAM-dependent methyltransferase [Acidimicrobiales bacterium]|nr:class I SAM-dependent methyltransferase [Acidimicrobiales bacterium]MCB9371861.1 class I SAM-dependent methyltransferase [Microthrixaceae bacterium]
MDPLPAFPSGVLRALPPVARAVLREQRRRLLRRASGRVLDLGDGTEPDLLAGADEVVRARSAAAAALDEAPGDEHAAEGSFDTVVSVLHLAAVEDLATELAAVRRLLTPGGRLLFLEPARQPGPGHRLRSAASPLVRLVSGWEANRDLPLAIRSNHLIIIDIERINMPPVVWPLRTFVLGAATRRPADLVDLGADGGDTADRGDDAGGADDAAGASGSEAGE